MACHAANDHHTEEDRFSSIKIQPRSVWLFFHEEAAYCMSEYPVCPLDMQRPFH